MSEGYKLRRLFRENGGAGWGRTGIIHVNMNNVHNVNMNMGFMFAILFLQ